jgi:hypothetical protein
MIVFDVGGCFIKGESSKFGVIDWILFRRLPTNVDL